MGGGAYQLLTGIFIVFQSHGLAFHPHPIYGICSYPFFLISGFCIHYPNTSGNIRPSWKTYLIRRFWRIYPAYFAALLFTAGISYLCLILWGDKTWDVSKIFRVATLTQNYPPGNGQFLSNPSLWTIPLEIEFYLLYPLLFYFSHQLEATSFLWIFAFGISTLQYFAQLPRVSVADFYCPLSYGPVGYLEH